jgi:hypothetical protein
MESQKTQTSQSEQKGTTRLEITQRLSSKDNTKL